MKSNLHKSILSLGIICAGVLNAQTTVTGPSSTQSPYLLPSTPNTTITSIMTATNVVGTYTVAGLMDGMGAYDNGDGTFTALINHEIGNTVGSVRAHGHIGAFVSKWVINKSNLSVVSGSDLIQGLQLWNGTSYTLYNASNTSTLAQIGRLCSADLPAQTAFYNSATSNGTQNKIFLSGEEVGNEGRCFAHVVSGPDAGTSYQLPYLGRFSWENALASPVAQDKTIVVGLDDSSPGQVYVYIGNKTNTGLDIDKAGLTGGTLYGVAVTGMPVETSTMVIPTNTTFSLVSLGNVSAVSGSTLNANSISSNVTNFLRPEDGAWDPSAPNDFYFVTTNGFGNPSRMYRLRFNNINTPENGGTITAVLDGTEGQQMMDNLCMDGNGHVLIQEDPGNQAHVAKIWEYNVATDALTQLATHDATRFVTGGTNFLTQDEESSGIIDMNSILGPGWFLFVDQAHYSIPAPVMEGGQLLALYKPALATGIASKENANSSFNLYPNPAADIVTIALNISQPELASIKVKDVSGRVIVELQSKSSENVLNINTVDFSNGIYMVEVTAGDFIMQKKLVVTH